LIKSDFISHTTHRTVRRHLSASDSCYDTGALEICFKLDRIRFVASTTGNPVRAYIHAFNIPL